MEYAFILFVAIYAFVDVRNSLALQKELSEESAFLRSQIDRLDLENEALSKRLFDTKIYLEQQINSLKNEIRQNKT
jgi:hypothetical protein